MHALISVNPAVLNTGRKHIFLLTALDKVILTSKLIKLLCYPLTTPCLHLLPAYRGVEFPDWFLQAYYHALYSSALS